MQNKKSIIICGSISSADEILNIQSKLEEKGYTVEIPWGVKKYRDNNFIHADKQEAVKDKQENNLIKGYYDLIKEHDVVLVVNIEKNGVPGYIGGNTFLEMGFAFVLGKPLYVLNPLPDSSFRDELEAMSPIILNGDLDLIR